ncbi:LysR family transcriptional regulator [Dyella terrae]|uniref:LysR family transcriptional regulator n=1 Tax=Dyella terrae TaxID=522259 RepID=UPI001EFDC312|nr:LysR family transcriptional regulator [Dyella terrae]ULU25699.1 LysR family transcriptional regulator [Dyella terrae]
MISLERFDIFKAIVDTGSLSAAAKALGTSRAVVSFNLKRLEEGLGVTLLARNTRGLTLTDAGKRFYVRCEETLDAARRAVDEARGNQAVLRGELRITTTPEYAAHAVIAWVSAFMARHPSLHVHLSTTAAPAALIPERFDLAIRLGRLPDSDHRAVLLSRHELVVVAAPRLLERHGLERLDDPDAVLALPRVGYPRLPDQVARGEDGGEVTFASDPPESTVSADHAAALLAFARAGHGTAILPDWLVQSSLTDGSLVRVLRRYRFAEQGVYAVYPNTRHVSRAVRTFIDFLKSGGKA